MERYKNINGNSGVLGYEIKNNSIKVQFNSGGVYLYNYFIPGKSAVDHMKMLAQFGAGLNSYINTTVMKNYAERIR